MSDLAEIKLSPPFPCNSRINDLELEIKVNECIGDGLVGRFTNSPSGQWSSKLGKYIVFK